MVLLARRLRDTNDALTATSFLSVKGRVARALLSLAEAFGQDVPGGRILVRQKVTQSDLAAMTGIARENVSRILGLQMSLVSRLAAIAWRTGRHRPAGCERRSRCRQRPEFAVSLAVTARTDRRRARMLLRASPQRRLRPALRISA
jgi:hypothetical protein